MPLEESFDSAAESFDDFLNLSYTDKAKATGSFLYNAMSGTLHYSWMQAKAVPGLFRMLRDSKGARIVAENTAYIAKDVVAIVAMRAVNRYLQEAMDAGDVEGWCYWSTLVISAWTVDKVIKALTLKAWIRMSGRSVVMLTQFSKLFNEATKDEEVRQSFTHEVCKDCTRLRHIKGEFKDLFLYYAQKYLIDYLLSDIPLVGTPMTQILNFILTGQTLLSYRLANEGVCERHRAVYFREYLKLCFSLGLSAELVSKLLAMAIERQTGIPRVEYELSIFSLVSVYFVGLTHHMDLPKPVKTSTRKQNPLAVTHLLTSEALEVLMKGIQARAPVWQEMLKSDEPTIDFVKLIQKAIKIYRDERNQQYIVYFVPDMFTGLKPFFKDPVVKPHWRPIKLSFLDTLRLIDAWVHDFTTNSMGKTLEVLQSISGGKAVPMVANRYLGLPKPLATLLFNFFSSSAYTTWRDIIRERIVQMGQEGHDLDLGRADKFEHLTAPKTKEERVEHLMALTAPTIANSSEKKKSSVKASSLVLLQTGEEEGESSPASLPENVKKVLEGTPKGVRNYEQKGMFSGLDNTGTKRRTFYLKLFETFTKEPLYQLVICYAIYKNESGPTLKESVRKSICRINYAPYMREVIRHLEEHFNEGVGTLNTQVGAINKVANDPHNSTMTRDVNRIASAMRQALSIKPPEEEPHENVTSLVT